MRLRIFFTLIFLFLSSPLLASDNYFSIGLDSSVARVNFLNSKQTFEWSGAQIDFTQEWDKDKIFLSGWSFGIRKQSLHKFERELYLVAGFFKDFDDFIATGNLKWDMRVWGQAVYGIPSYKFSRVTEKYVKDNFIGYYRTFLVTQFDVPGQRVGRAGVLYPIISISAERNFGIINFEPMLGFRILRFGFVESEDSALLYSENKLVVAPTYGLKIGVKF